MSGKEWEYVLNFKTVTHLVNKRDRVNANVMVKDVKRAFAALNTINEEETLRKVLEDLMQVTVERDCVDVMEYNLTVWLTKLKRAEKLMNMMPAVIGAAVARSTAHAASQNRTNGCPNRDINTCEAVLGDYEVNSDPLSHNAAGNLDLDVVPDSCPDYVIATLVSDDENV